LKRAGFTALGAALSLIAGCHAPAPPAAVRPTEPDTYDLLWKALEVKQGVDFHGWPAIVMRSSNAEVVVVPAIGRVMQFRRIDDPHADPADTGPFWQNPQLARGMPGDENGWINYGGDKAWPAPQAAWADVAGRGWPPPATFDARPFTATVVDGAVHLVSEVDPAYGVRVERVIRVCRQGHEMMIETRYQKVSGPPVRVAVWTITQLTSPELMFMLLPKDSSFFPAGYKLEMPTKPRDLRASGRLVTLGRDPLNKTMIGNDADAMLWMGAKDALILKRPHDQVFAPDAVWADDVRAQIYTSSDDALPYVELELLGPVRELRVGESTAMTVSYVLTRAVKEGKSVGPGLLESPFSH
jgi:hypothetical protein